MKSALLYIQAFACGISAQIIASPQLTSFNSSFALSHELALKANFTDQEASTLSNIINHERSQYAGGPADQDEFYDLPAQSPDNRHLIPGSLIKLETYTNITNYTLSPNLAMSRFIYTTKDLNGTAIPASAFILWPFSPRSFANLTPHMAAPAVIWNHMTSGFFGPAAPSKHRNIWAGDSAPYALALAGYAVVAPDYAGLGVTRNFQGGFIPHQYLALPASANDAIYAYKAAKAAFSKKLSDTFVVMGQSQGGGVSWATSELLGQNSTLAKGHLGTVAVSPTTSVFNSSMTYVGPFVGVGLASVFPTFRLEDWLTPFGVNRTEVFQTVQGGLATAFGFFSGNIAKPNMTQTWYTRAYSSLVNMGTKPITRPMLVIQGTADQFVSYNVTLATITSACERYPNSKITTLISNGTGHVPTLDASRQVWLRWIEERFQGVSLQSTKCGHQEILESFLPIDQYQATWNSFPQWAGGAEYTYEVPLEL
ncbi:Alpha/Beta hydrolase protein [Talaromyces proteolyticus]|uniref:Alpha/Beta hydrolase protein n=1 Tax=Talaromyces proteolyticus TaxID=1131652 RepID=A0AAD4KRT2_9EURO|nr:Alpha/Beta hydrolase protein [Talaromyces proteolyticus]KAH8698974.1 Alpha/Beta hydrolase protein [Talaromyces proteolyticus]